MNLNKWVCSTEFEKISRLPVNVRFEQRIESLAFTFFSNASHLYMNDVFKPAGQHNTITRTSLRKLNQPLRKSNHGQNNLSYLAPTIWNNLPNSLKASQTLNTYEQRVKKHFFQRTTIIILLFFIVSYYSVLINKVIKQIINSRRIVLIGYCAYSTTYYDVGSTTEDWLYLLS